VKSFIKFFHQVRAGILSFVLVIGLVVALLIASLILLSYYYRISYTAMSVDERLELNTSSGIAYLMAQDELQDSLLLDLYDTGKDSVILTSSPWGVFQVLRATAFSGKHAATKIILKGHKPSGYGTSALYVSDENKPVSISGNTEIRGDCYLPVAGIRTSRIENRDYTGSKIVYGNVMESETGLPSLDANLCRQWEFSPSFGIPAIYRYRILSTLPDSLSNSFTSTPLLFQHNGELNVTQNLSGNIILFSNGTIILRADSKLTDILVFARNVIIEEGFIGKLQIFAWDAIEVGENSVLNYPSVLAIKTDEPAPLVKLGARSRVEGVVLLSGTGNPARRVIDVAKESTIYGQVYTDGSIQLKGNIYGHLMCRKFLLTTPSAIYENHLLDAVINYEILPEGYLGAPLWWKSDYKGILKWLD
jgi:hypothetical protein